MVENVIILPENTGQTRVILRTNHSVYQYLMLCKVCMRVLKVGYIHDATLTFGTIYLHYFIIFALGSLAVKRDAWVNPYPANIFFF